MRLAEFILQNIEPILAEWEAFAATLLPPATGMNSLALRDHAHQILEAVAKDLSTSQTSQAQSDKSKGLAAKVMDATETAAETHATLRASAGFNINQMMAEYRALASVLRLWADRCQPEATVPDDMIRFNEAIDQAIAESVSFFSAHVERARNLLLGMLGHDMRDPLAAIQLTAKYLTGLNAGEKVSGAASRLIRGGGAIKALLDDLIAFSRTKLGVGIEISRAKVDLAAMLVDEVEQLRGVFPDRQIMFDATGDSSGEWDGRRLQQLLRNLVSNAITYGSQDAPVSVVLRGDEADVRLEVINAGPIIEQADLDQIFDPLKRGRQQDGSGDSLGLGLYIVREIARAHGGEVTVRSKNGETTFAVRLPRRATA